LKIPWIRLWFLLGFLMAPLGVARAQDALPPGPIYIVQPGDTLWSVAQRFSISQEELVAANNITNPDLLKPGDALVIPGFPDLQGRLETRTVVFGETLGSLSRQLQIEQQMLVRLNHLTSANELYVGSEFVYPVPENEPEITTRAVLTPGASLLEMAVLENSHPWNLAGFNHLEGTWDALPGDVLQQIGESHPGPSGLPPALTSMEITPLPTMQGKTEVLRASASPGLEMHGEFMGHPLQFFSLSNDVLVALQGVHAMAEPGVYPLTIEGTQMDGAAFGFTQMVLVVDGGYWYDPSLTVDPATVDPAVTLPENNLWNALAQSFTPDKWWDGLFGSPVSPEYKECWPSWFGSRRSYNGGPYDYFHSGQDFCGATGQSIFAPAPGIVVYTGELTVRGNATMIDHGWGVYTGYMHQSEILVQVGDRVETGQLIGYVGETGRVTGPHLHWEVWVGGVQVDPMDWLYTSFP
jgi:murein DD-endopeptidase MepM/ murein hydrolase activator NlpD